MSEIPISRLEDWTRLSASEQVAIIGAATERIRKELRGKGPLVQVAVLADLFSMLLAGVQGEDKAEVRKEILKYFLGMVDKLTPHNEKILLDQAFGGKADQ